MGSANLYDFNFSGTTANLDSSNNHYSVYGVKKVNDKFTLKGIGGSVFDYKGKKFIQQHQQHLLMNLMDIQQKLMVPGILKRT